MIKVTARDCNGYTIATLRADILMDALKVIRPDIMGETTNDTIDALLIVHDEIIDMGSSIIRSKDHSMTFDIRSTEHEPCNV